MNNMRSILFRLMAGLLAVPVLLTAARADCVGLIVEIGHHHATFRGVVYDDPAPGQSTWFYMFKSGRKPAISHVTFELKCPDIRILDAGMWDGISFDSRLSKAGKPEPKNFPAAPKGDPTTKVTGLKFDLGFADNATRYYYFTVNGNFQPELIRVALKAGPGFTIGEICGPDPACATPPVTGSVGDFVWLDANANGLQDEDEPGIAGVTVYLLSTTDEVLDQTTTDADGLYLFEDLVDGDYRVRFTLPAGYLFTEPQVGGDGTKDSDADPVTGLTPVFALLPGEHIRHVDAGLMETTASLAVTKAGVFNPGTTDPWALCSSLGPAQAFNALVFGDFTATGGDTDGRLAVGGNAVIASGYSVGIVIAGHPLPDYFGGTTDSFIVGGDLTDGAWGVNGNIVHGGERIGPTRWMSNGNVVRKVSPVTFRKDGNVPSDGSGMTFDEIKTRLSERSELFADLDERGVVTKVVTTHDLTLEGEDAVLNVFNLDAVDWNSLSRGISITAPSNSTVLINVRGETISLVNSSMTVWETDHENVLINYVDAKTVETAGFKHTASVMAMQADAFLSGASIDGRAIFGGSVVTTNGFEFHNFYFTGDICAGDDDDALPPHIVYSFTVENTGNVPISNIVVEDALVAVNGGPIDLDPDAIDTETFTAVYYPTEAELAAGVAITNTATAVGVTASGHAVSDTAMWVVGLPEPDETDPGFEPPPEDPPEWMKADFVLRSVDVSPSPSVVGARFEVIVRVSNEGDLPVDAGDAGAVELWSGSNVYSADPQTEPDSVMPVGTLQIGETAVLTFTGLRAPFEKGTYHAMAVVNRARTVEEYSTGNNHGGATYTLEPLNVIMAPQKDGMLLRWDSVPGYYYFVERSDALGQPFNDIADNVPATPPQNVFLDETEAGGTAFYRVWGYKP